MTTDADWKNAIAWARENVKPGDRITVSRCPGRLVSFIFTGWDGNWMCSATRDDIAATSIYTVNGKHVIFAGQKPRVKRLEKS